MKKLIIISLFALGYFSSNAQVYDTLLTYKGKLHIDTTNALPRLALQYINSFGNWVSFSDTARSLISVTGQNYLSYSSSTGVITAAAVNLATANVTGVLPIANGGTNNGSLSVTNGNLLYTDGTKVVGLGVGAANQHLLGGTIPHWGDTATAGGGGSAEWAFAGNAISWNQFLGTTNNFSLPFKQNSVNRVIIDSLASTNILGQSANDGSTLSSELTTTGSGTNWAGSGFSTGYTHTTGSTTALTTSTAAITTSYYLVTYTITSRTTGSIVIAYGGISSAAITATGSYLMVATATTSLSITPTTDFNGILVLSIKAIIVSTPIVKFKNSSGVITNEIRAHSDSSNTLMGKGSGGSLLSTARNNTAYGDGALALVRADWDNTAIGANALGSMTGGNSQNTAVGSGAMYRNTTGANNAGIGYLALNKNTTAGTNTAVGAFASRDNVTGAANTAVGYNALVLNLSSNNDAFGAGALAVNTTGAINVAVGGSALSLNVGGDYGTAVGGSALRNNTASENTAMGANALLSNTSGTRNVAIGAHAARSSTTVSSNTVIGHQGMFSSTTGQGNTVLGSNALYSNNTSIATFGAITGGSGYTNGTYSNVQMILSSGATATRYPTADITVSGGAVTAVTLLGGGIGVGLTTVLTANAAGIGGTGSGFSIPVATLAGPGSYNIMIGDSTGYYQSSGSSNVVIGAHSEAATLTGTGQLNISNLLYGINGYQGTTNSSVPTSTGAIGVGMVPTSTLSTAGSFSTAYTATATSISATVAHNVIDVTATGQTITLPTAVGIQGREYTIKLTASGTGTVATTSSQTIDGSTTYSLSAQYKYVTVKSTNANWIVIANN